MVEHLNGEPRLPNMRASLTYPSNTTFGNKVCLRMCGRKRRVREIGDVII
jgi:hypothetical protein